jgi:hypothetical protein
MPISFDAMTDLVPEPFANVEAEIVEDTLSALSMSAPTAITILLWKPSSLMACKS